MRVSFLLLSVFGCTMAFAQNIPIPPKYSIVDSVSGDLDKDGVRELVVAYNTQPVDSSDLYDNIPRELIIYKLHGNIWQAWKRSSQALLGSQDGGMMGDPFGELKIKSNILYISHSGGSGWKWGYTDKYRFQNNGFYLIGHTSHYGRLCEYWEDVDFNLSTGRLFVKKEYEKCDEHSQEIYKRENELIYKKSLVISLENRRAKEIKIITPKYKHEIYVATAIDR